MDCPDCGHECIENDVAYICPNCDYLSMKKLDWNGQTAECPKCKSMTKVYKHSSPGKSFVCENCNTIGRFLDEKKLSSRVVRKDSELGKRLSWLFEVPCKDWRRREEIRDTICRKCDLDKVCESHLDEIDRFCRKEGVEIYMHQDFIEIVHS